MSASEVQGWIAVVGGLLTAVIALLGLLNYRTRRDYLATVGAAFSSTVEALADEKLTKQIAAAVLLRRFFDPHSELGRRGQPYQAEAVNVIAGMLREENQDERLQKALADGLRYARNLRHADLQQCQLTNAYLGLKTGDKWVLDLTGADFFDATLDSASLKSVKADEAVFYLASLKRTVFERASLARADFRGAELDGAKFAGAFIEGAKFDAAKNIPPEVGSLLDDRAVAIEGARLAPPEEES
jgi:uncharacterized protein YjbI with pentapeptide repeats